MVFLLAARTIPPHRGWGTKNGDLAQEEAGALWTEDVGDGTFDEQEFGDFWDAVNELPNTDDDDETSDSEGNTDNGDESPDDGPVDGSPDSNLLDDVRSLQSDYRNTHIAYRDLHRSFDRAREEIDETKALFTQKATASRDSGNPHDAHDT